MPYKPTGRPVGRPPQEEPRLLTYSFKADATFMEKVRDYAWQHRTSVGELIREGLKWRLEEGDPLGYRYAAPPPQDKNGNTTIPEKEHQEPVALPSAFDEAKYVLGALCAQAHEWAGTGQSLRQLGGDHECRACKNLRGERYRQRKRQAKQGQP